MLMRLLLAVAAVNGVADDVCCIGCVCYNDDVGNDAETDFVKNAICKWVK